MNIPQALSILPWLIIGLLLFLHFIIKPKYYPGKSTKPEDITNEALDSERLGCFGSIMFVLIAGLGVFSATYPEEPLSEAQREGIYRLFAIVASILGLILYLLFNPIKFGKKP